MKYFQTAGNSAPGGVIASAHGKAISRNFFIWAVAIAALPALYRNFISVLMYGIIDPNGEDMFSLVASGSETGGIIGAARHLYENAPDTANNMLNYLLISLLAGVFFSRLVVQTSLTGLTKCIWIVFFFWAGEYACPLYCYYMYIHQESRLIINRAFAARIRKPMAVILISALSLLPFCFEKLIAPYIWDFDYQSLFDSFRAVRSGSGDEQPFQMRIDDYNQVISQSQLAYLAVKAAVAAFFIRLMMKSVALTSMRILLAPFLFLHATYLCPLFVLYICRKGKAEKGQIKSPQ